MSDEASKLVYGDGWEDTPATCLGQLRNNSGQYITQASLDSISCKVFDEKSDTPDTPVATPTVIVADCVFDTLQTGEMWTKDSVGYNFAHEVPGASFPLGDRSYRIEYVFTQTDTKTFARVFWHRVKSLRGS